MAKVILITSREIADMVKSVESQINDVPKATHLENQFFNNSRDPKGLFYALIEKRDDKLTDTPFVHLKYNGRDCVYVRDLLNKEITKPETQENVDMVLKQLGYFLMARPKSQYNKTSTKKIIGKIKYIKANNDAYIFLAHEFPHDICPYLTTKANYLNALVTDIAEFLKDNNIMENWEWTFINHDKDWQNDGKASDKECKNNLKPTFNKIDVPILEKVLDLDTTKVYVFQHYGKTNPKIYGELIVKFAENYLKLSNGTIEKAFDRKL
ncbi:MAG: hypothetical protein LBR10_14305 [Prevotellaceae bacterium]|jgi:hypothetical protein|nr:hypothetical protein [Prevotellaceae bacterium]